MKLPNILKQFYSAIPIKNLAILGLCIASQAQFNKCTNGSTVRTTATSISVARADVSKLKKMTLQDYKEKIAAVSDIAFLPEIGLHVVVDSSNLEKLEALLASPAIKDSAIINVKDENGDTPLMRALKANQPKMAKALITYACDNQQIANLMMCNSAKKYPLTLAIEKKHDEVANQLIEKLTQQELQTIITSSTIHPLSLAIKNNLSKVAEDMIAMIAQFDPSDFIKASPGEKKADGTPLHVAVTSGKKELLEKMISKLTDEQVMKKACKRDASPLHLAIEKNNGTAEVLIQKLDPFFFKQTDNKQRTPLHRAAACNQTELFQLMWAKVVNKSYDTSEIQSYLTAKDKEGRTLFARAYLPQKNRGRIFDNAKQLVNVNITNTSQDKTFLAILRTTKENIDDTIRNLIITEINEQVKPTKPDPGKKLNSMTQRNNNLKEIMRSAGISFPDSEFTKETKLPSA